MRKYSRKFREKVKKNRLKKKHRVLEKQGISDTMKGMKRRAA